MKKQTVKIKQLINDKIRNTCERIPPNKRKCVVLGMCLLFVAIFSFMLWKSFQTEGVQKLIKIEHITPLDLPEDSLSNHLKKYLHGK